MENQSKLTLYYGYRKKESWYRTNHPRYRRKSVELDLKKEDESFRETSDGEIWRIALKLISKFRLY